MPDEVSVAGLLRDLGELVEQQRLMHAKLDKRDDLIRSLGDRVLRLANSGEKNTEALLLVRQKLTEIYEQREFIRAGHDQILERVAVLTSNVGHVERDVRDATGQHRLMAPEPERKSVAELVGAWKELPVSLKVLLSIVALLVAGHAEIAWVLQKLLGPPLG